MNGSVSGRNTQERKVFCRASSWEVLLFANSSLALKGLMFVNIFARYQQNPFKTKTKRSHVQQSVSNICL